MTEYDLELVSFNLCPYGQRSIIILEEKNISHKRTYIDVLNTPDWFKIISPLGRVPLLKGKRKVNPTLFF
ncbi:MAG: glutathione S-transferase N-terminal domain-containing protein [Xanthomonadales bacterium]|nr:glutathione S-transferase N-terminal domain-containing protein [Xanthomonadales bacterium]